MKCTDVKEWLTEHLTVTGLEVPDDIRAHMDDCPGCLDFYRELLSLAEQLTPLADISLTTEESAQLKTALDAALRKDDGWSTYLRPEKRLYTILRAAVAVGAVVVIVFLALGRKSTDEMLPIINVDELELSQTTAEDLVSLFINGEGDYLPSLIDQEQSRYLTGMIQPAQAEDVLESVSTEEIEWLMENFTLEI